MDQNIFQHKPEKQQKQQHEKQIGAWTLPTTEKELKRQMSRKENIVTDRFHFDIFSKVPE